jgi:Zn-dependent protease with chaperone function
LIPIPAVRERTFLTALKEAGERIVRADRDLVDRQRRVAELLAGQGVATLRTLVVAASPFVAGFALGNLEA